MEIRRYRLSGRVQGVGFRFFTRRAAEKLGVDGWVRNRLDGAVEVMARADPFTLDAFETMLQRGPMGARVDEIEKETLENAQVGDGFQVRF